MAQQPTEPVLTLAIETSNPGSGEGAGVCVGRVRFGDGTPTACEVLAVEPLRPTARHDDDLMPAIDRACRTAGAEPRELRRVAVSIGPGGYTALRVACAAGKMIAQTAGAKCVGVPSALVAALGADTRTASRPFAAALASKGDSAFVTRFMPGFETRTDLPTGQVMVAADLAALGVGSLMADSHLPAAMRAAAEGAGIAIVETRFDPAACLRACGLCVETDPTALNPLYAREPEAVTLWRNRSRSGS